MIERDCYTVKDLEENAKRFFQAHNDERLGKSSIFPYSSNYAGETNFQPYNRSRSHDRDRGNCRSSYDQFPRSRSQSKDASSKQFYKPSGYNTKFKKQNNYNGNGYIKPEYNQQSKVKETDKGVKEKGDYMDDVNFPSYSGPRVINNNIRCYLCQGFGHVKKVCPSHKFFAKCTIIENSNLRDNSVFFFIY